MYCRSGIFQGSCLWFANPPNFLGFKPSSRAIWICAWDKLKRLRASTHGLRFCGRKSGFGIFDDDQQSSVKPLISKKICLKMRFWGLFRADLPCAISWSRGAQRLHSPSSTHDPILVCRSDCLTECATSCGGVTIRSIQNAPTGIRSDAISVSTTCSRDPLEVLVSSSSLPLSEHECCPPAMDGVGLTETTRSSACSSPRTASGSGT